MLGTLLDRLQSLFSKNVLIGSIPLFGFLFANSLMAYRVSYHFQRWVKNYFLSQDATRQALLSFSLLLIVVIVSYVLSTLSVPMREVLEGKRLFGFIAAGGTAEALLQERFSPYRYIDGTHFFANFGHLSGYSSAYYTYMWSLVIAKDLFSAFDRSDLFDAEVAARYRDRILAQGGRKDAADLVEDFLGRPFGFESFADGLAELRHF